MKLASTAERDTGRVPGPRSRITYAEEQRYIAPGLQRIAQLSELTLAEGHGCTVVDVDGNEYLDFFAGVAVASLGHTHPRFVEALKQQLDRIIVGSFTSHARLELVALLAELAPGVRPLDVLGPFVAEFLLGPPRAASNSGVSRASKTV